MSDSIYDAYNRREYAEGSRKWVKHVVCEGARFHVLSWRKTAAGAETRCSEQNCIINQQGHKKHKE